MTQEERMKANLPYKACKKEIKNPSEKNQKDFCFLCEIIINARFQQSVFYNSRTRL